MGVLPLQFKTDSGRSALGLTGSEVIDISIGAGVSESPGQMVQVRIERADGSEFDVEVQSRLDTKNEIAYYRAGGILQYVLNNLVADNG